LLSKEARPWVGGVAILTFLFGAIFATIGTWASASPAAASTSLAYWFAFASLALAALWVFAKLTVRRPLAPLAGTAERGALLQYIVFGGMAFLVLGLLAAGILTQRLVAPLQTINGARGLITFLIAIGTIAIAIILTLASVVMDADDTDERLSRGKEILTVLVGVLGTIVGFYFASNTGGTGKLTVAVLEKPPNVAVGAEFRVEAITMGGEEPYESPPIFTFGKEGKEGAMIEGSVSAQGRITVRIKVPDGVQTGVTPFVIGCRDRVGNTGSSKDYIEVVPKK
jgi:hypothetical protein